MGKAKEVVLGSIRFRTMTLAHQHFQEMLQSYDVDDHVSDEDAELLLALLKRHPSYAAKVGVGIARFEVIEAEFGSQCFAVRRIDGSYEDFSYKKCISEGGK